MSNDSEMCICMVCKKPRDITTLHYCLCDTPVCEQCIESLKTDASHYRCPKCDTEQDLESTKLFRIHDE